MTDTARKPDISSDMLRYRGGAINAEGVVVEQFLVEWDSLENLRLRMTGRGCSPGFFWRLTIDGLLWMSDTDAERRDHLEPLFASSVYSGGRGLVHGLGMGLVVAGMLNYLDHVDVVEADERVIRIIGGEYKRIFGDRITLHHDDALTRKWPRGSFWDVVWHDIWPDLAVRNLSEMAKLHRSYGGRSNWQGSWGKELIIRGRREGWLR